MVNPGATRERVYQYVKRRILEGSPPSVREVQRELGLRAVQSVQEHLDALVGEGRLEKLKGVSRGYRLPGADRRPRMVPLLGRVQAGELTEAIENLEGYVGVDHEGSDEELFALRVRGRSMEGAGIHEGDIVIVRKQATADSGRIVVALVDNEATVKRLKRSGRRVELHPENPDFSVIVPDEGVELLGVVVEVRRYLEVQQS